MKFYRLTSVTSLFLILLSSCSSSSGDSTDDGSRVTRKGFDVTNCGIDRDLLFDGGPPRDGIPAVLNPVIMPLSHITHDDYLHEPEDLVVIVEIHGERRAYPESLLWRHEIVNDVLGNKTISVSYCPLTGSTVAFDRRENETFRVSGLLYQTNLVMYDTSTDSLWPQMSFSCQCGDRRGEELVFYPVREMTWDYMVAFYPDMDVVIGANRVEFNYGFYPYGTYDRIGNPTLLFPVTDLDETYPIKSLTMMVFAHGATKGYPHLELETNQVFHDQVGNSELIIIFDPAGRYANAYLPDVGGQKLSFSLVPNDLVDVPGSFLMRDAQTGTLWNTQGEALDGPMAGSRLTQATNSNAMWFSFKVSLPRAEVYQQEG